MVIAIISILFVFFSVMFRFLCAASGEIKMFITSTVQCVRLTVGRRTLKMCCYRSRLAFDCCF